MTNEPTRERGSNRAKIIAAAYRVLAESGYEAATIKEIARVAGVAPGLVHYYFADKDELLVAVLQEAADRYTVEMRTLRALPPAQIIEVGLVTSKRRASEDPDRYRLRYELFALGLRNPAILPGVAALLASGRQGIGANARAALHASVAESETIAAVLQACFDGLALQKMADPAFDLDAAYEVLTRMVRSLNQEAQGDPQ